MGMAPAHALHVCSPTSFYSLRQPIPPPPPLFIDMCICCCTRSRHTKHRPRPLLVLSWSKPLGFTMGAVDLEVTPRSMALMLQAYPPSTGAVSGGGQGRAVVAAAAPLPPLHPVVLVFQLGTALRVLWGR
jgi:hypothetical protein